MSKIVRPEDFSNKLTKDLFLNIECVQLQHLSFYWIFMEINVLSI